jgi:hypothetical protein
MTALFHIVVMDEIGIGPFRPFSGRLIEFIREDANGSWDFDALGTGVQSARGAMTTSTFG